MGKEYWVYYSHGLQGGEKTENNGKMTVLRSYLSHLWLKFQNARLVGHILVIMTRWAKKYWVYHSHGLQDGEITKHNQKMMLLWVKKKVSSKILQLQVS
jgi:hypothetical protein